jgi:peptidyl-prolyl cis-trans isomerase D
MLTEIRSRATGWIAWFIVILITIPFALWGINSYFEGVDAITVASVNGEDIDQQTYRYALEDQRSRLSRVFGSNVDPNLGNSPEFKKRVVNGLIDKILLSTDADVRGYRVSNEQLNQFIQSVPQFQREGKFAPDLYESAVRTQGFQLGDFERRLRQQHIVDQIRIGFTDSEFVTEADLESLLRLVLQHREFDYTVIRPQQFVDQIEITDADIEKRYQENPELYQRPEKIKVQYVRLAVADLANGITPREDELRQAYESGQARYLAPEQRRVSHILIAVKQDSDEETRNAALEEARSLTEQARSGVDFGGLAKQHSDDPGSAAKGGDLGVIAEGVMVKPFEDAAYQLQEGEVSDPVKTRFGYHVIKITELVPESVKPFAEIRDQIEQEERKRLAEVQFIEQAETFRNLAYEQPDRLEPVAEELGLSLQTSDWFSAETGTGVAENRRIRDAAFGDDVFVEGLNSETIEVDVNTLVVLRKLESRPAAQIPLAEVRDQIEQTLIQERARERVTQLGGELLDMLQQGSAWDALIQEQGLEVAQSSQARFEQTSTPSREVVEAVFESQRPKAGEPVYGGVATAAGDYALFQLRSVEDGDPAKVDKEVVDRYRSVLSRRRGYDYFLSYQDGLRTAADIKIFQDQL